MKKILASVLDSCLLFPPSASAGDSIEFVLSENKCAMLQARLGGHVVQFYVPEGYSRIRHAAYPELREFLQGFTDFGKGDVLAFRLDDDADTDGGARPRYIVYVSALDFPDLGRTGFERLLEGAAVELAGRRTSRGETVSRGQALAMQDMVWNFDDQRKILSISRSRENHAPNSPGNAFSMSLLFSDAVLYMLQLGEVSVLDGFNLFIRHCAANIEDFGLGPVPESAPRRLSHCAINFF